MRRSGFTLSIILARPPSTFFSSAFSIAVPAKSAPMVRNSRRPLALFSEESASEAAFFAECEYVMAFVEHDSRQSMHATQRE